MRRRPIRHASRARRTPAAAARPAGLRRSRQRVDPADLPCPSSDRANITQVLSEEDLMARHEAAGAAAAAAALCRGVAPPTRRPAAGTQEDADGRELRAAPRQSGQRARRDPDHQSRSRSARMSFVEHLSELRKRLRNAALIFLVVDDRVVLLRQELLRPADPAARARPGRSRSGSEPVFCFASPTEPFWVYTKLAMYARAAGLEPRSSSGSSGSSWRRVSTARRSGWRWW